MTWMSMSDIRAFFNSVDDSTDILTGYALANFAWGITKSDYSPNENWAEIVTAYPSGHHLIAQFQSVFASLTEPEAYFLLFQFYYHHELLVDPNASDLEAVGLLLHEEIRTGQIFWPYQFGRLLYDKFNDEIPSGRTDHLRPSDAETFLANTPQGVYQVFDRVSGPCGLLNSKAFRYAPPSGGAYLWHCSDTGCNAPHYVDFQEHATSLVIAQRTLREEITRSLGPPSEWQSVFRRMCRDARENGSSPYYDLLPFLGDGLVAPERQQVFARALRSESSSMLRNALEDSSWEHALDAGEPEAVADAVPDGVAHQLLMLLPDGVLVAILDEMVVEGRLSIPPTEIREAKARPPSSYVMETVTELSSLGARSVAGNPTRNLASHVWNAYSHAGLMDELSWTLGIRRNGSTEMALFDYLSSVEPETAVKELVISRETIARHVANAVDVAPVDVERRDLTRILAWKLGFNLPRYDDTYRRLKDRLTAFVETARSLSEIRTEDEREAVRRSGVNLFVSIEVFLDLLLSYNVWILHSDHFAGEGKEFRLGRARRLVADVLGETLQSGTQQLTWDRTGANTLGVLLRYLQESASWMGTLTNRDSESSLRPQDALPHYDAWDLVDFPMRHIHLWADAAPAELDRFVQDFTGIVTKLARCRLSEIRNGLDHMREPQHFPGATALLSFAADFQAAFEEADRGRFVPKEWWLSARSFDRYGRARNVFTDYNDRTVELAAPNRTMLSRSFTSGEPVLMAPGNLLGRANSELVFTVREASPFAEYWDGYPRRRIISSHYARTDSSSGEESSSHREEDSDQLVI